MPHPLRDDEDVPGLERDDLGISKGTLAHWVLRDKVARGERLDPNRASPEQVRMLEKRIVELEMERDVLKRSVVLWVKEATDR